MTISLAASRLRIPTTLALLLAIQASACEEPAPAYPGTLAEWRVDSAFVDSLSRLVPTDSLHQAMRAALTAEDLEAAHQRISCIKQVLMIRYGTYPAVVAIERMEDTVWKGVDPQLLGAHDARLPDFMTVRADVELCGYPANWRELRDSLPEVVERVDPMRRPINLR